MQNTAHEFRMTGSKECHCTCGWKPDALLETPEELWADFFLHHASNSKECWTPGLADLNWCHRFFGMLREGGTWTCDAGLFQVNQAAKQVKLLARGFDPNLLARTESVIWLMGWSFQEELVKVSKKDALDKSTECGKVQA